MLSLLSLPRELRDDVIDYVVQSSRPAPGKPDRHVSSTEAGRVQFDDMAWSNTCTRFKGNPTYFESSPDAFEPIFAGLLRTCHQLRTETLERLAKTQIPHVLDLLIVNGMDLWATWLSMPRQNAKMIERLQINVRLAGALRNPDVEDGRALNSDHFSYLAQRLLNRIVGRGTSGPVTDGELDDILAHSDNRLFIGGHWDTYYIPHCNIKRLDIDFNYDVLHDADEIVPIMSGRFEELCDTRTEGDPFFIPHPTDYLNTLSRVLGTFLDWSTSEIYVPHQRALREHIGGVKIPFYRSATVVDWTTISESFERIAYNDFIHSNGLSVWTREIVEARIRNGIHKEGHEHRKRQIAIKSATTPN